jgi:hypothetical protein
LCIAERQLLLCRRQAWTLNIQPCTVCVRIPMPCLHRIPFLSHQKTTENAFFLLTVLAFITMTERRYAVSHLSLTIV